MLTLYLTAILLFLSPVQGLSLLPAALMGMIGFINLRRFNVAADKVLVLLVVLNYVYWILNVVLSHDLAEILTKDFMRWQVRGLFCLLPLLAWVTEEKTVSESNVKKLAYVMVFSATAISIVGLIQFLMGHAQEISNDVEFSISPMRKIIGGIWFFGMHRSHLAAGGYYLSVVVLLTSLLCFWRGKYPAVFFSLLLMVNVWAFLFAKSRTFMAGYISALLLVVAFSFLRRRKESMMRTFAVVVLSAFLIIFFAIRVPGFTERLEISHEKKSVEAVVAKHNVSDRIIYWKSSLEMIRENPIFGVGLGNFHKEFVERGYELNIEPQMGQMMHAHNSYLHILAELGIVGFVLFFGLWGIIIKKLVKSLGDKQNGSLGAAFIIGVLCILVGQFIGGLFDFNVWSPSIFLPITALAGVSIRS